MILEVPLQGETRIYAELRSVLEHQKNLLFRVRISLGFCQIRSDVFLTMTTTNTATNTAPNTATTTMKTIRFGIEIETVGLKREEAATVIKSVIGGTVRHAGGGYDTWECVAPDGRVWKAMRDSSLSDSCRNAEIVSPILRYEDIETLQNIVRAVRAAGARVDDSCGIHYARDVVMRSRRARRTSPRESLLRHCA